MLFEIQVGDRALAKEPQQGPCPPQQGMQKRMHTTFIVQSALTLFITSVLALRLRCARSHLCLGPALLLLWLRAPLYAKLFALPSEATTITTQ